MANCTGANAQYSTTDSCLGACAAFPAGTIGATGGNNLECRAYHATNSAGAGATTHCPHAGPAGDGVCGSNCEGFCTVALAKCPAIFADMTACTTACGGFASNTARYNSTVTSGNSFSCREYHLSVAATGPSQATTHCGHIAATSATCQ
jgi:hypothetical protein